MSRHRGGIAKPRSDGSPQRLGAKSISITRAKNGLISRTEYDQKPSKKGESYPYDEGDTNVHESVDSAIDYMKDMFSGTPDDAKDRRIKAAKASLAK